MALRWSAAWSMLAVLLVSGTALAAGSSRGGMDAPGEDLLLSAADATTVAEPRVGYIFAWPEWCVTPEGGLRFGIRQGGDVRTGPSTEIPACAEAASGSPEGPALESAGEAWAAPARGRSYFWAGATFQVDGLAARAFLSTVFVDAAPPAEDAPAPQVAPDLAPPAPLFPVYEPTPDWTVEQREETGLAPSDVRGIEVDHTRPTDYQMAAQRVRAGIAASTLHTEKVVIAGLVLLAAGFALYQRITPARSLEHDARTQIRQVLLDHPDGATAGDVGRLLDMNRKTAEYHLTYLARLGQLRTGMDEHGARLYSLKAIPERKTVVERMLLLVRQKPGVSVPEAAEALGVSRSSADRYAKALVVSGSLESRLVGGERKLFERLG